MTAVELSKREARRLALSGQGLGTAIAGRGLAGALAAVERLGYVQIDTISIVERAHHHTLFNRVPGYRRAHLDKLLAGRRLLEYWAHAAAYLPMADYRFCLPRMREVAARRRHWFEHDHRVVDHILARIRAEGALKADDFDGHTGTRGMWQWGPVKRAIEYLFHTGELMVTRRENFQKVYDLPERVLPDGVDTREPSTAEYANHLVSRFLDAHGIARVNEFGHLRRGMGTAIREAVDRRVESGTALPAKVRGIDGGYVVAADFESRLAQRVSSSRAVLLSPFDNLVIQRERIRRLFDFDYQLECYVPGEKRRHGYFCMPVLWRGRLAARLDAKADRAAATFRLFSLTLEDGVDDGALITALAPAVGKLAAFNDCDRFDVGAVRPRPLGTMLAQALSEIPRTLSKPL